MGVVDAFDRFNEKVTLFCLRFVGPPSVGNAGAGGPATTPEGRARDVELRSGFERVTGPDGQSYLVARD